MCILSYIYGSNSLELGEDIELFYVVQDFCLVTVGESRGRTCLSTARTWMYASNFSEVDVDMRDTVPFRLIRPSRVTGPVVLAEFGHLSRVTTSMADDFWWIQKMVKKGL